VAHIFISGPIIRCNPWELHIQDPEFFEVIYAQAPRDKVFQHVQFIDAPLSTIATIEHELHRTRRKILEPYFSKARVSECSRSIQDQVNKSIRRLDKEFKGKNKVVVLSDVFNCFTGDAVADFCYSWNQDFLSLPDFRSPLLDAFDVFLNYIHIVTHFPIVLKIFHALPDIFIPAMPLLILNFQRNINIQIQKMAEADKTKLSDSKSATPLEGIMNSSLPAREKTMERILQEGFILIGAGQTTTKAVLTTAMFHLLQQSSVMDVYVMRSQRFS